MKEKDLLESKNQVIPLEKHQIDDAAEVLGRAFFNYPLWAHVFPDASKRKNQLKHLYRFMIRYGLRYGEVQATSEKLEGIAVWLPPEESNRTMLKQIRCFSLSFLVKIGRTLIKRYLPIDEHAEKSQERSAPFPHWYLMVIGIDPAHQLKGHGNLLLKQMIERLTGKKSPIFLETYLEKNVGYYENLGFKVMEEFDVPDTKLRQWSMVKD